jgi:flagellar motor switch protein FliG
MASNVPTSKNVAAAPATIRTPQPASVPATTGVAEESPPASRGLTSLQKIAVVLTALGPERSKNILQHFSDEDIERIIKEIANTRFISTEEREKVLGEAYGLIFGDDVTAAGRLMSGRQVAKQLLVGAVGGVRARNILDRLDIPQTARFDFIGDNDCESLAHFLEMQLPQTIAVTLLHMRPDQAQKVLTFFPEKLTAEVISRMVHIDKVDREMVEMLRKTLERQLELSQNLVNLHGNEGATSLLRSIPATSQQKVLEAIGETNPQLRKNIERQLLTFEDLFEIDDREFSIVVGQVYTESRDLLPLALRSCSPRMKSKVYANITSSRREEIEYRLETMGRKRLSEVEGAQQRIVQIAKELSEAGRITFGTAEDLV